MKVIFSIIILSTFISFLLGDFCHFFKGVLNHGKIITMSLTQSWLYRSYPKLYMALVTEIKGEKERKGRNK